jgi:hypothetical protein
MASLRFTIFPHTTQGKHSVCVEETKLIELYRGTIASSENGMMNLYGNSVTGSDAVDMRGMAMSKGFENDILVPLRLRLVGQEFQLLLQHGHKRYNSNTMQKQLQIQLVQRLNMAD